MASKKILVVDDEEGTLRLLEKRLQTSGYDVTLARTGREALDAVEVQVPDVILMDIMLPDIDGAEAVQMIRSQSATKDVPIIFISSIVTEDPHSPGHPQVLVGKTYYPAVPKPIDFEQLRNELKKIFS